MNGINFKFFFSSLSSPSPFPNRKWQKKMRIAKFLSNWVWGESIDGVKHDGQVGNWSVLEVKREIAFFFWELNANIKKGE